MTEEKDTRKIERKAKSLLLGKDIPPAKMELVRSLLQNKSLLPEEKYSAVIEIIQSCPDKPVEGPRLTSIELREGKKRKGAADSQGEAKIIPPSVEPSVSGVYIDEIHDKYRKLKFFKKRYLVHSGNRLGFWFKKRLIPTRRLLSLMREIVPYQERAFASIGPVLIEFLRDATFDDPSAFNYLALMTRSFGPVPLSRYEFDAVKWMERRDFEAEMKDYTTGCLSYYLLSAENRENMLQLFESRLRGMKGYAREIINDNDSDRTRAEKEKRNLEAERKVFDCMLDLRSFLSGAQAADSSLSRHLESRFGIRSLVSLLVLMNEALVFHREVKAEDLVSYYRVSPPVVSSESYNYAPDLLKKYGRDEESLKKRKIEALKEDLGLFEEIYLFLKFEISGQNVLLKSFDDQWRLVDKRRGDSTEAYKGDFISFIDGLLNYFNNSLAHCVDGSILSLENDNEEVVEGRIFTETFFERELRALEEVTREFFFLRTNNPNLVVPYDELQRIFKGQIKSMIHIGAVLKKIGGVFYHLGTALHRVLAGHKRWAGLGKPSGESAGLRVPLDRNSRESMKMSEGMPVPFHEYRLKAFINNFPLARTLAGMPVINADFNEGFIIIIVAFCYQLAYECGDEGIQGDLQNRKSILSTLRELADN
jgi:hypothetical protein